MFGSSYAARSHCGSPRCKGTGFFAFLGWLLPGLLACSSGTPGRPSASAILITLDTTRADAIGALARAGAEGASPTPVMDRIAEESIVFTFAHTVSPQTQPSHASMLTGLYPPGHRLRVNGLRPLSPSYVTLAELARDAGLRTAAFIAAPVLASTTGLAQGFEVYDEPEFELVAGPERVNGRRASEVVSRAIDWIESVEESQPFFLWVHLFDPHFPYDAPAEGRDPSLSSYLQEVAYVDQQLGRLVGALERRALLDRCSLTVIADHGESLGAHGEDTHGILVYEEVLRVPFLLRLPGGVGAQWRSDPVSVVDVHPTLAGLLGLSPSRVVDGIDLLGQSGPGRGIYFESLAGYLDYGWSPIHGWLNSEGKYLHSSAPELYDVRTDPAESSNLLPQSDTSGYLVELRHARFETRSGNPEPLEETASAALNALGYTTGQREVQIDPGEELPDDLPAPAQRTEERRRTLLAQALVLFGRHDVALAELKALTQDNPENLLALRTKVDCLLALERRQEAIPALTRLIALTPAYLR